MRLMIVLLLFTGFGSKAQNLVANGSFEEENICSEFIKNCAPEAWIITSLQSHFYFDDPAHALYGQHFLGLVTGMSGRYGSRNFITTQLLCGLRKGSTYRVEFYLMEGVKSLDSAGLVFTPDPVLYRKFGMRDLKPSVRVSETQLKGKGKWKKFSTDYIANGTEAFLNIGYFGSEPIERYTRLSAPDYYFYIDSISLRPLDPKERLCDSASIVKSEIYEMNDRHQQLERRIYPLQRRPPQVVVSQKTILQRIDTLIIPDIFFATNSYALTQKAQTLLDSFALSIPVGLTDSLVVEGHTDNRGSRELNQPLSENRAGAVAEAIRSKLPSMPFPVPTRGWADSLPAADNNTAEGRQRNRRVAVYLYVRE